MKRRIVAAMLAGMMVFGVAGSSMAAENSSTEKITEAESEISTEEEAHPLFEELSAQQFVFSSIYNRRVNCLVGRRRRL